MSDMNGVHLASVDLNVLVALEALLAERSVTRAAQRLSLTQSAVSHALARLRVLMDDPLLVRAPGGMRPTARALALAPALDLALRGVRTVLAGPAVFEPATARRTFTLATADLGEFVLLPALLERLAREAPGIDVVARPSPDDPAHALADGIVDLVVDVSREARAGLYRQRLFTERFVCVLRDGHPLAHRPLTLARYASLGHLLVSPSGRGGAIVDTVLARSGRARRVVLTVPHFLVAPHVVARTDLIWTAPERMARAFAATHGLVMKPAPVALPTFTLTQRWHERMHRDPAHAWFRRVLEQLGRAS